MFSFLEKVSSKGRGSKNQAKERLKVVLIHDRIDLPIEKLDEMKQELVNVITRYVDIDPSLVRFELLKDAREQRLVADIPIHAAGKRKKG